MKLKSIIYLPMALAMVSTPALANKKLSKEGTSSSFFKDVQDFAEIIINFVAGQQEGEVTDTSNEVIAFIGTNESNSGGAGTLASLTAEELARFPSTEPGAPNAHSDGEEVDDNKAVYKGPARIRDEGQEVAANQEAPTVDLSKPVRNQAIQELTVINNGGTGTVTNTRPGTAILPLGKPDPARHTLPECGHDWDHAFNPDGSLSCVNREFNRRTCAAAPGRIMIFSLASGGGSPAVPIKIEDFFERYDLFSRISDASAEAYADISYYLYHGQSYTQDQIDLARTNLAAICYRNFIAASGIYYDSVRRDCYEYLSHTSFSNESFCPAYDELFGN